MTNANSKTWQQRLVQARKQPRAEQAVLQVLQDAAAADDAEALWELGVLHEDGLRTRTGEMLVSVDYKQALRLLQRAAELGHPAAMNALANALDAGRGGRVDAAGAARWYKKALAAGDATAAFNLAISYRNRGKYREAVRWLRHRALAKDGSALLELAKAELYGQGTRRNVKAALARLEKVKKGDKCSPLEQEEAWLLQSQVHREGWLGRVDFPASVKCLRGAAEVGSAAALGMLQDLQGLRVYVAQARKKT